MRRRLATAIAAAALSLVHPTVASAQRFQITGPNDCLNCHDHEAERAWYEKQEMAEVRRLFPDKGANAGHINALKQLETPKSNDYAKAIGLRDKYDLKGSCVQCHGTVFSGDANAGVSCESCHGPASGYMKPHQTKGAYDQSVAQYGMTKLIGNIAGWAQQCTTCHIVTDQKLVAAGHPSGADFDLSKKYAPVSLHFKKKYSPSDVAAFNRAKPPAAASPAAAPAPAAPAAPPATAPTPAAPVVPQTTTNNRGGAAPAPPAPKASPSVATATPPAAPPVAPPPAPPVTAAAPTTAAPSAPATPAIAPPAPLPEPAPAPRATTAPGVASLPAGVALVQGKLIAALTQLLQQGASAPIHTSTPSPVLPYSGPDAALIELQRQAIALALETLGQAPAAPATR